MVVNTPKPWLLHYYYNKTMVNFHLGYDSAHHNCNEIDEQYN